MTGNKPAERADQIDSHEIATVDVDVAVPDSDGYLDDQDFEVGDGDIEITYEVDDPSRPSAARDIYVSELATAAKNVQTATDDLVAHAKTYSEVTDTETGPDFGNISDVKVRLCL